MRGTKSLTDNIDWVLVLLFVVLGPIVNLGSLIEFTDLLILSMAYPNIVGAILLSPKLAALTKDYIRRLKSGEMQPVPPAQFKGW